MMDTFDPLDESATFDDFNFDDDISEPSLPDVNDIVMQTEESNEWRCRICSKTFTYRHNLMRHYRNVEHIEPNVEDMGEGATSRWFCDLCPQTFSLRSNLNTHQRHFHGIQNAMQQSDVLPEQNVQAVLAMSTDSNENRAKPSTSRPPILTAGDELEIKREHVSTESAVEALPNLDDEDDLLQPIGYEEPKQPTSSNGLWSCKICLRTFTFRNNLTRHMRNIKCSPPTLEQPRKTIEKLWYCDRCPQSFTLNKNLHRHRKMVHQIDGKQIDANDEEPPTAVASNAGQSTSVKHELLNSRAPGLNTNELSCRKCLKTFTLRSNLIRHIRHISCVPADVDPRKYNKWFCDSCPQSFTAKATLRRHQQKFHGADNSSFDIVSSDEQSAPVKCEEQPTQTIGKKPLWQCDICSKTFTLPNNLYRHKQDIHMIYTKRYRSKQKSSPGLFSCEICLKTFTFRNNLIRHNRNIECYPPSEQIANADDQQWICDYCSCEFLSRDDIVTHMRRVHADKCMVDCEICSLPFRSLGRLETHMREKHRIKVNVTSSGIQVTCNYCAAVFPSKIALDSHKRDKHMDRLEQDNTYKCSQCPALFSSNAVRKAHLMRMHKQPTRVFKQLFKCYICDETFKFPGTVVSHLETHNVGDNLRCCFESCDERLDSSKRLYYHLQKHLRADDEKRTCDKCQRSYSVWTFDNHRCSNSAVPEFMCHYCGKTCVTKYVLKLHMNTHTGDKPYKCNYCNRAFNNSYTRNRHQNTHTGEKPCKCTVANCGRAFGQHIDLYRHLYKVHGIFKKKYPCTACDEVFPENSLLKKHQQVHGCH